MQWLEDIRDTDLLLACISRSMSAPSKVDDAGEAAEAARSEDASMLLAGSPLHQHLIEQGLELLAHEDTLQQHRPVSSASSSLPASDSSTWQPVAKRHPRPGQPSLDSGWSESGLLRMEVDIARKLRDSELLVHEDEEFISNFILTEDALESYYLALEDKSSSPEPSSSTSTLLFSASMLAVSGAVFFLSERTRLAAATLASALPAAAAAASATLSGHKENQAERQRKEAQQQDEQFQGLVDQLLTDMKLFRQLVRKSLNLLQGAEYVHSGYMLAVNAETGASLTTVMEKEKDVAMSSSPSSSSPGALSGKGCYPALRRAAYQSTVELIKAYRQAVERLMQLGPLAGHVDMADHYIAFVEWEQFDLVESAPAQEAISVKMLKDVVQLALIQQSEYLRRFALTFSEKVREDKEPDKAGVVGHVRDLIDTLNSINGKLSKVFDYHQALGLVPNDKKQTALMTKRQRQIELVPLRTVYTSLFSTGLHLQNSLLKVRQLEKAFDAVEKKKTRDTDMLSALAPADRNLLDWLKDFKAIQGELNACVGCLEEGMTQIDSLQAKDKVPEGATAERVEPAEEVVKVEAPLQVISADTPTVNQDEVFVAVIEREEDRGAEFADNGSDCELTRAEREKKLKEKKQSERVLLELRTVLVDKAVEHKAREASALARMSGEKANDSDNSASLNADDTNENIPLLNTGSLVRKQMTELNVHERENNNGIVQNSERPDDADEISSDSEHRSLSPPTKSSSSGSSGSNSSSTASSSDPNTIKSAPLEDVRGEYSPLCNGYSSRKAGNESEDSDSRASPYGMSSSTDSADSAGNSDSDEFGQGDHASRASSIPNVRRLSAQQQRHPIGSRLVQSLHDAAGAAGVSTSSDSLANSTSAKSNGASTTPTSGLSARSLSTPDLKRLQQEESSSPYVSLEKLKNDDSGDSSDLSDDDHDDDSDSDHRGSADETQQPCSSRQPLLKTYRRPLRPAAARNKTRGLNGHGRPSPLPSHRRDHVAAAAATNNNTYIQKKHNEAEPLFLPSHPMGFESSLAQQVASKASAAGVNGFPNRAKEDVFGSSDEE